MVHVTNRLIHGMPFTAKRYMREMILGILARGQALYPAQIVACLFMGNHYHMILSGNAAALSPFMNYCFLRSRLFHADSPGRGAPSKLQKSHELQSRLR